MKWIGVCAVLLGSCLVSCSTVEFASRSNYPVGIGSPPTDSEIIGHFSEQVGVFYTMAGGVPINRFDLDTVLAKEVKKLGGDGIANLSIRNQFGGTDLLVTLGAFLGGTLLSIAMAQHGSVENSNVLVILGTPFVGMAAVQSRTVIVEGDVTRVKP